MGMAEEVHFVKIVQGGIWGDVCEPGLLVVVVVLSGLVRLRAGSVVVRGSGGAACVAGVADAADSLCVRFGILNGGWVVNGIMTTRKRKNCGILV